MNIHQPACLDIREHVAKVYATVEGIPNLDRLAAETLDDFRAERLDLDPTYYEVVKRLRAQTIASEGAEG